RRLLFPKRFVTNPPQPQRIISVSCVLPSVGFVQSGIFIQRSRDIGGTSDETSVPLVGAVGKWTVTSASASRPATTRTQWLLWLALTVANLCGIVAVISIGPPIFWAKGPLSWYPWIVPCACNGCLPWAF